MSTHTLDEAIGETNASQKPVVIFIHGLWSKPSSWDRWAEMFEAAGYVGLAPGWPAEIGGAAAPETIGEVAAHFARIAEAQHRRPALIGHSFGGLIAQILAGRGLSAATVAIDPAPFRGVLPLPSALRPAWPGPEAASDALDEDCQAPPPGLTIFQAAAANCSPWTEPPIDSETVARGPLLIISGETDHTVPPSAAHAAYELQRRYQHAVTEFVQLPRRGHSPTIDSGWREVAETALTFVRRFL